MPSLRCRENPAFEEGAWPTYFPEQTQPPRSVALASGEQVLCVEGACLRLEGTIHLSPLWRLTNQQQPHGRSQSNSNQLSHMRSGLHSFLNGTHTQPHTPTPPHTPGFLAGNQKCKAMFWLGSATCSQGSPNHGWGGRGEMESYFLLSLPFALSLLLLMCFIP